MKALGLVLLLWKPSKRGIHASADWSMADEPIPAMWSVYSMVAYKRDLSWGTKYLARTLGVLAWLTYESKKKEKSFWIDLFCWS